MNVAIITEIPIYHITHIRNLRSVIEKNGLFCDSELEKQGIKCEGIAYQTLKDRRSKTSVPVCAKGILADYVPFYFANRSPMLGAIHKRKVIGYLGGQKEIIYLVSCIKNVIREKCQWCFTDGHAIEAPTHFSDKISEIDQIDWYLIGSWKWWNTLDDPDRMRRKQAEFLVYKFFPWQLIETVGVYDNEMKQAVGSIVNEISHKPLISVEPEWYYESKRKI